ERLVAGPVSGWASAEQSGCVYRRNTQALNRPTLFLIQIDDRHQCVNRIYKSIECWNRLIVSACNNLIPIVCHLENNCANNRPSNQNKNRPERRIPVPQEEIEKPSPKSKKKFNVALPVSFSFQARKYVFCRFLIPGSTEHL